MVKLIDTITKYRLKVVFAYSGITCAYSLKPSTAFSVSGPPMFNKEKLRVALGKRQMFVSNFIAVYYSFLVSSTLCIIIK